MSISAPDVPRCTVSTGLHLDTAYVRSYPNQNKAIASLNYLKCFVSALSECIPTDENPKIQMKTIPFGESICFKVVLVGG